MWSGFRSIDTLFLQELITEKVSGPLCLVGLVPSSPHPVSAIPHRVVKYWARLDNVFFGPGILPYEYLVILEFPRLQNLVETVVSQAHQSSQDSDRGLWIVVRQYKSPRDRSTLPGIAKMRSLLKGQWREAALDSLSQAEHASPLGSGTSTPRGIYILDMLKFRWDADYHHPLQATTGVEAYRRYTQETVAIHQACGAKTLLRSKPLKILSRPTEALWQDWSELVLTCFPNYSAYQWITTRETFLQASIHRHAALQTQSRLCFVPNS